MKNVVKKAKWTKALTVLLWINSVAALAGGLNLLSGKLVLPASQLTGTGFTSYYFPGVILFAVVGGSALLALLAHYKHLAHAALLSLLSGVILVIWIVGEIASIQTLHFLQFVFLASGIAVIYLTPAESDT